MMADTVEIRESLAADFAAIGKLYPEVFPDEDLLPIVTELLQGPENVLSLVATVGEVLAGHVIFTPCRLEGGPERVALLAPLAVAAARQRQGIGSAIVRAGLHRLGHDGTDLVCVLGDPAYYGRFGFVAEERVLPPYPLAEEWRGAWQSLSLGGERSSPSGALSVPRPWRREALWTP